jgi:hypothetical protein
MNLNSETCPATLVRDKELDVARRYIDIILYIRSHSFRHPELSRPRVFLHRPLKVAQFYDTDLSSYTSKWFNERLPSYSLPSCIPCGLTDAAVGAENEAFVSY